MSSQKMSNKQLVLRIKAGENVADNMLQLWQQNQMNERTCLFEK